MKGGEGSQFQCLLTQFVSSFGSSDLVLGAANLPCNRDVNIHLERVALPEKVAL